MLAPLPLKIAVDSVIGSHPIPGFLDVLLPEAGPGSGASVLFLAGGLVLSIALLNGLQQLASRLLSEYAGGKLVLGFRARLFRHAQRLSISYHDSKGPADSLYRIQYDAAAIHWIAIDGVIPLVTATLMLVGMTYVTAQIHLQLAVVALAVAPIMFLTTWAYSRRLRSRWHRVHELDGSAFR